MTLFASIHRPTGWVRPALVVWALLLRPERTPVNAADATTADVRVSAPSKAMVP